MSLRVALLDPSARTTNLGDDIIVQAAISEVPELATIPRVATHEFPTEETWRTLRTADAAVFAGTNALAPKLWRARQWPSLTLLNQTLHHKVVYLGVGWGADLPELDLATRTLIKRTMRPGIPIGVRDTLTLERALRSGLDATYIGCPTMWSLPDQGPVWPGSGAVEVITTLTGYSRDEASDQEMLDELARRFEAVLLWPQGGKDTEYLSTLRSPANLTVLEPTLDAFVKAAAGRCYIGTRLHGGVRAMHEGSPALIISVDHRATSIARDTGLRVSVRGAAPVAQVIEQAMAQDSQPLSIPRDHAQPWLRTVRSALFADTATA